MLDLSFIDVFFFSKFATEWQPRKPKCENCGSEITVSHLTFNIFSKIKCENCGNEINVSES